MILSQKMKIMENENVEEWKTHSSWKVGFFPELFLCCIRPQKTVLYIFGLSLLSAKMMRAKEITFPCNTFDHSISTENALHKQPLKLLIMLFLHYIILFMECTWIFILLNGSPIFSPFVQTFNRSPLLGLLVLHFFLTSFPFLNDRWGDSKHRER